MPVATTSVNPLIILSGATPAKTNPLSEITIAKQQGQINSDTNELNQLKLAQTKLDNMDSREKSRLTSVITGAAQLDGFLQSGDLKGAESFLMKRRQGLGARIAAGENVDTADTDEAIQLLQQDPEGLKGITSQSIKFGQMTGILKTPKELNPNGEKPALLQTLEAYKNASDEDKKILRTFAKVDEKGETLDAGGNIINTPGALTATKNKEIAKATGKTAGAPIPATILTLQDTLIDEIKVGEGLLNDTQKIINKIDNQELELGLIANAANRIKNGLSISDADSQQLANFEGFISRLRNDTLRLQKGTQTEGDATRALEEIITNRNDEGVVRARLSTIQELNQRAIIGRNDRITTLRNEFGRGELSAGSPNLSNITVGGNQEESVQVIPGSQAEIQAISTGSGGSVLTELPQGAQQIGTSGGKPVYQTPDGKKFVQE